MRIFKIIKNGYIRFIKIRGNPREIGLGFALGIIIGMTPTMGFQMIIAVFLAFIIKWNKLSSAAGVWITNPVTAPFVYTANYFVGAKLLGIEIAFSISEELSLSNVLKKAPEVLGALTLGGFVLGAPLAVLAYYLTHFLSRRYQERINQKLAAATAKTN